LSIASPSCRIDWRPSRQLCLALFALGLLGAAGAWLSDLPLVARSLLAAAALAHGTRLAWREWRRAPCALAFEGAALLTDAGLSLDSPVLRLRGPLACLQARDPQGRRRTWLWSADTLPVSSRRQLRLRLPGQSAA